MKSIKLLIITGVMSSLLFSCGKEKQPEEIVRDYSAKFAHFVANNQIDSIRDSYPSISVADSISLKYDADSIKISKGLKDSEYIVNLSPDATITLALDSLNNVKVLGSKGLFAFPSSQIEMAKKTGLWNDSISDIELYSRLNDKDFEKYLAERFKVHINDILSIGPTPQRCGAFNQKITNKSNKTIDGNDYKVVIVSYMRGYMAGSPTYSSINGKTLKPGESMSVSGFFEMMGGKNVNKVKWAISEDEVTKKYTEYTGHEYEEYLKSGR